MLVSHQKKFIYTKTFKTGSTSVESYFEPFCMPPNECSPPSHGREEYFSETGIIGYRGLSPKGKRWYNHMSAKKIKYQLGQDLWDRYFKFCVIRNPFDKLISAFHHRERQIQNKESYIGFQRLKLSFVEMLTRGDTEEARFKKWLYFFGFPNDRDKYFINKELCVDFFIRFENLQGGVKHVCRILELPFEPESLPQFKMGLRPNNSRRKHFFDSKSAELVYKRFQWEIDKFGYQ